MKTDYNDQDSEEELKYQNQDIRDTSKIDDVDMLRRKAAEQMAKIQEQKKELDANRKAQVGSGDRSERIRTYNYPQGRVSDHRINLTLYNLEAIMEGQLDDIIGPLVQSFQAEALKQAKAA